MKLGDWLRENDDFVDYLIFPESIESELIGYSLKINHGEKLLFQPLELMSGVEVAKFIMMRYNDKWIKVSEYLENYRDIGLVSSKEITDNFDGTITVNATGEVVNLESAFNTDDFVNSDKQENKTDNQHVNSNKRDRVEKYVSTNTANHQIMNYNNSQLSNVIIKDIVDELCIKIY